MVATSIHYIVGVLISYFHKRKYSSQEAYKKGLIALIPDFDSIIISIFFLFSITLEYLESSELGVVFLSHRGFSHSLLMSIIIIIMVYFFTKDKKKTLLTLYLLSSHLFLDFLTAWKLFPFLPFSFTSLSLGIIEVFDPIAIVLSTIAISLLFYKSLKQQDSYIWLSIAFFIVAFFGFFLSAFMGEFNTILYSISLIILIAPFVLYYCFDLSIPTHKILKIASLTLPIYIFILILLQLLFSLHYQVPLSSIEPLEDFQFSYNAHTYEIENNNSYEIAHFSLKGMIEKKTINKFRGDIPQNTSKYEEAYKKSIPNNWINAPVYYFNNSKVTITYAKQQLSTPHMPGPDDGITLELKNGFLIRKQD